MQCNAEIFCFDRIYRIKGYFIKNNLTTLTQQTKLIKLIQYEGNNHEEFKYS